MAAVSLKKDNIQQRLEDLRFRLAWLQQLHLKNQPQLAQANLFPPFSAKISDINTNHQLMLTLNLLARQLQSLVGYSTIAFYFPGSDGWLCPDEVNIVDCKEVEALHLGLVNLLKEIPTEAEPFLENDIIQTLASQDIKDKLPQEVVDLFYTHAGSWLCVPLKIKDKLPFWVSLTYIYPDHFTARHIKLANLVYTQLVSAYSRLNDRAQTQAVQEERQRMARELHDSVTQVFYGIELAANTANTLLKRQEPERAAEQISEIMYLAEAGLAEMRALLLELRPESLASEGLVMVLFKQTAALRLRHNLNIITNFGEEPKISIEAKEVFYRVAQEALQNIVKHAQATGVQVCLIPDEESTTLIISDDGRGFDPNIPRSGHFGLTSMRERADSIGAKLEIQSMFGSGTQIKVQYTTNI